MAKTRVIDTRFWIDDYISNLDPVEKLLFLYLLTNPSTDISGVYEIPLKNIALDTGLDKEMVIKILGRFKKDQKIFFEGGWVAVKNFQKYQNTNNPKILKGIEIGLNKAPKSLIDKLSITNQDLSHSNSNSNSNSNSKDEQSSKDIVAVIDMFKEVNPSYKKWFSNKTQRGAISRLIEAHGIERLEKVIKILPQSNRLEFVPVITSPVQLEDKFAQLATALQKVKNKQIEVL